MNLRELEEIRSCLCALQNHIRDEVLKARSQNEHMDMAAVVAETAADTIYQIDKISEEAIFEWFERHWPESMPVEIVMEGVEEDKPVTFPYGTAVEGTLWKCLIDPIDGTRNIMYDKRAAWILAGVAPQRGRETNIADIVVSAMTELPPSKQTFSDQLSAVIGQGQSGIRFQRINLVEKTSRTMKVRPSQATDFKHGFASMARFFPEGKELTARVEEKLWEELYGLGKTSSPLVFDDQYISTGGQIYEILSGHDRMLADLRPIVFRKLGLESSLVCHPYDICTWLILQEAGGIIEQPDGSPLSAPMDTTSPVSWIGFANSTLAEAVRPVLRRLMQEHLDHVPEAPQDAPEGVSDGSNIAL
ncbi:MAG: inositol monophosphatase [Verrucomicrobiae bacterium]|nr:inositol monophosphatase [Verrucomicrobiae bacterium]